MSRALDDMIVGLAKVFFEFANVTVFFFAKDSRKYDVLLYVCSCGIQFIFLD